jgi:hypothetical protein
MPLMAQLTDSLRVTSNPAGDGTRLVATFEQRPEVHSAGRPAMPNRRSRGPSSCATTPAPLVAASTRLEEDTNAILAQASQLRRHARRRPKGI